MSHTYSIHDIETIGDHLANRLVDESCDRREIAHISVDSRRAAKALLAFIEDDLISSDSAIIDGDGETVMDVWGECNAGDFRIYIHIRA